MIYLDNNATTRPAPETVAAVQEALTSFWQNPSSVHRPGQAARQRIELARRSIGELIGAKPRSITFTSGGTEAIDLAIRGSLRASGKRALITTAVEHAAIRDLGESISKEEAIEVRLAPLDNAGRVIVSELEKLLDPGVGLVSVQWANNETGVIQPVHEIGALCRERRILFHCDATQWVGKMPTLVSDAAELEPGASALPVDLLTFSPHKFHGPKGVGALYAGSRIRLSPRIRGVQELGRRGGTENVPGIVGAGVAADLARAWLANPAERGRLGALRDSFERQVVQEVPGARVNGIDAGAGDTRTPRLWNTTNIAFPRLEAEALLLLMSEKGLCASAGAACSSGSLDPSPVLLAMGIPPELAHGSVRFSLSRETTSEELDRAAKIVVECARRLTASMPGAHSA